MRIVASLLVFILLFSGQTLYAQQNNYHDPRLESLIQQQQKGNTLFKLAEARRDSTNRRLGAQRRAGKISQRQFDIEIKLTREAFGLTSRRLTRRYRAPVVERMREIMPGLRDSLGTDFYLKNPNGTFQKDSFDRKVINPKHRGWKGDFDFKGSSKSLSEFGKFMEANGAKLDTSTRADGRVQKTGVTQHSVKKLEFTVNSESIKDGAKSSLDGARDRLQTFVDEKIDIQNKMKGTTGSQRAGLQSQLDGAQKNLDKASFQHAIREKYHDRVSRPGFSDSMNNPGSSTHRELQDIRANDVETFNSASMKKGQVFRRSVEVEDHIKKASKALGEPASALHNNSDLAKEKFQAMTKSTQKVIGTVNMSDADLNKILKNRGYSGDAKAFKAELELFKQEKKFATSGSQADVARMQKISKDVFTASREKATRQDTARLKSIEKSMNGLSPEARAMAQRDIVDGQERLRATREANLTREGKSGYRLGKAPDIPANSKIPAGNWFLNGMGIDPSSTIGKFFGQPPKNSKILKYGGPALIPLSLLMANQIIQSKVHEVADEKGIVIPTLKLTGKTLIEMADFAGVSPKQFIESMKGDLDFVQKNIKKWGLQNTPLEAQALLLAATMSPIKSIVKGGVQMAYQLGSSVVEVSALAATLPPALYQSWTKMSAVEKRIMTDKLFRQASIMTNRRKLLPELELEIAIDTLAAGLSTKLVGSPALTREFLESSIEAETLRDEAAIKRWEAKTGKLSAQQKADFLKERDERRRAKIKNPFERWDRAADVQKGLGARLTDIAAELAKGRGAHSLEELEKLQNDFKTIKDEIELFKGIVDRMSEMDRKAIFAQDAAELGASRNSTVGFKELVQLKGYRDWVKGYDRMQGRMDDMLHGARGLDNLIYDAKAEQDQDDGLPSLDDLLGQLGDPTKLTIDDLAGLIAIGMDLGAVLDALSSSDGEAGTAGLTDALEDLKTSSEKARKQRAEKRKALKQKGAQVATTAPDKKPAAGGGAISGASLLQGTFTFPISLSSKVTETTWGDPAFGHGTFTITIDGPNVTGTMHVEHNLSIPWQTTVYSGPFQGVHHRNGRIAVMSFVPWQAVDMKRCLRISNRAEGCSGKGRMTIIAERVGNQFIGTYNAGGVAGDWVATGEETPLPPDQIKAYDSTFNQRVKHLGKLGDDPYSIIAFIWPDYD